MATKNKGKLDNVVFSYDTDVNTLEEENKFLRETIESLRQEVEIFKKPPLLVCEVKEPQDGKSIVKLQNGNEFLVEVSSGCEDLNPVKKIQC